MGTSVYSNMWSLLYFRVSSVGLLHFILYNAGMWNNLENKFVSYADDTLHGEIISLSDHNIDGFLKNY